MTQTPVPMAAGDRVRDLAYEAAVRMRNRFVEKNPALNNNDPSFISRPALKFFKAVGSGPIRAVYHQPGTFQDSLFVVSYDVLYRIATDGTVSTVYAGLAGADDNVPIRMCATGDIGTIAPHLFFCDGTALFVYTEDGYATSSFSATAFANNDVVRVGSMYYKYTTGSVDAGTPAGTSGSPWLLNLTAFTQQNYDNLYHAINASGGTPGTDYSTATTANADAQATRSTSTGVVVAARLSGIAGNAIPTTTTGADMTWSGASTSGGGTANVNNVPTPDDVGVIDVGYIANYVIVIPAQGQGINGRFYWIQPGEVTIDPLDYATAERSPDPIYQCVVFNDQFWLPGQNTTEVWYPTGDPDAPMQRLQGIVFDRGTYPGTAIAVKESMVIVDNNGGVFQISGGLKRISTPDIEERFRKAFNKQQIG